MPLTGATPEIKKRILAGRGYDPDKFDIDSSGLIFEIKSTAPAIPGPLANLSQQNQGLKQPSDLESFGRGAAESVIPTGLGLAGAALAAAPFTGGTSLLLPLLAGAAGAVGGSALGTYGQRKLVPESVQQALFTRPEDVEANPISSALGGLIPSLATFKPNPRDIASLYTGARKIPSLLDVGRTALTQAEEVALANAAVNLGVGVGTQVPDLARGNFDAGNFALNTIPGILLTRPTALGRGLGFKTPTYPEQVAVQKSAEQSSSKVDNRPVGQPKYFGIIPEGVTITPSGKLFSAADPAIQKILMQEEAKNLAAIHSKPFKSAGDSASVIGDEYATINKNVELYLTEKEAQAQHKLALEKQKTESLRLEAEAQKAANERRKLDLAVGLKKGYGEEAPLQERLQQRIEQGRLQQEENIPSFNIGKELNAAKKIKAQQEDLYTPLTEAEQIQEDYDLGRRHSEESKLDKELPFNSVPIDQLQSKAARAKVLADFEAEAKRRGLKVVYRNSIKNAQGREVLGRFTRDARLIELNKGERPFTGDVLSEEVGHGMFYDMMRSASPRDQRLALDAIEFADPKNRKFRSVDEFEALPQDEQIALEEAAMANVAVEGYRQRRVDLYGNKRERFDQWWKNTKSHFKNKFGLADEGDITNRFITRIRKDAPYGTRPELLDAGNVSPAVKSLTSDESKATSDYQQYVANENKILELVKQGKGTEDPEIQALWKEKEAIKNRHGGMPPPKDGSSARTSEESKLPPQNEEIMEGIKGDLGAASVKATSAAARGARNYDASVESTDKAVQSIVAESIDEVLKRNPKFKRQFIDKGLIYDSLQNDDPHTFLDKYVGQEFADEMRAKYQRALDQGSQTEHDNLREYQDTANKASRKAEELEAFTRKDVERHSTESKLPPQNRNENEDVFSLNSLKELKKEEPFGASIGKDGKIAGNTVLDRLDKLVPKAEAEILRSAGIKEFLSYQRRTPAEIKEWIAEHGPKVEVHSYGMEGKVSEAKREYDRMTHEWYDTELYNEREQEKVDRVREGVITPEQYGEYLKKYITADPTEIAESVAKAKRYKELWQQVKNEEKQAGPHATSAYDTVSALPTNEPMPEWTKSKEGKNVQRVDVVIPQGKTKVPDDPMYKYDVDYNKEKALWFPDNLHENLPNTLGWAMIQYKTGPKGEKIAVIAEAQSRWGQYSREMQKEGNSTSRDIHHPLLRDYNRLILKAAIEQARKEGATHIVVSDAETAMMTEGHDLNANHNNVTTISITEELIHRADGRGPRYPRYEHLTDEQLLTLRDEVVRTNKKQMPIPQEPGMRLNYDHKYWTLADEKGNLVKDSGIYKTKEEAQAHAKAGQSPKEKTGALNSVMEELTGQKGEKVSLGEHKNAIDQQPKVTVVKTKLGATDATRIARELTKQTGIEHTSEQIYDSPTEPGGIDNVVKRYDKQPRENLIFKNPDGTPKTDVSGMMYPIGKGASEEPFSLFGRRYSEESKLPAQNEEGGYPKSNKSLGERLSFLFSGTIDRVRKGGTATHEHVANKAEQYLDEVSLNNGRLRNTLQQLIMDSRLDGNSLDRVDAYGRELYTNGASDITLNANEKALYDQIQDFSKRVAAENKARKIETKEGYWPAILNSQVAHDWNKNSNSPQSNYWKKQWLKHAEAANTSYTKDELKEILQNYVDAVASHGDNPTLEFGALRKAEGIGLPIEMQDNNLVSRWSRYSERAAKDMASYKHLETDPVMRFNLRVANPETEKIDRTIPKLGNEDAADISGEEQMRILKDSLFGVPRSVKQPRLNALNRLVSSSIMQAPTGIRNVVNAPATIAPLIGGVRNAKAIGEGLLNVSKDWAESFRYGVRQKNLNDLQFGASESPDGIVKSLNFLSDAIRKISGRDWLEQFERAWFYSTGKLATQAEFVRAAKGNKKSIAWLKEWGKNVDGGVEQYFGQNVPDEVVSRIAAKVANYAAGTYDARGLPMGLMDGHMAPFVQLARWSIERANTTVQRVVLPAIEKGDYGPLLTYTVGAFLTGAAIKELNEIISGGKKSADPDISEALAADNYMEAARATFALGQLGSFAGIIGDGIKMAADYGTGHNPTRNPLAYPTASFVSQGVAKNIKDLIVAIEAGEPRYDAVLAFARKFATDNVQNLRSLYNATAGSEDTERANVFRDKRVFEELTGRREPSDFQTSNPFLDLGAKKFKRTGSVEEAASMLPDLLESEIEKGEGDIEAIRKNISGLKRNSFQSFPDINRNPVAAAEYLEYLTRTQGADKAMDRLIEYLTQQQVNKVKSSMVPSL